MQYFNIQVASQLSGVASATIRAWEKRYNAVIPERGDNKHRLYSEKDIEKLALLFRLTEVGQSIGKIAHLNLEELKQVYSSLMHRPYDQLQVVTPHHERVDFDKILTSLVVALSAYKLDIISHELEKAKALLTPRDLCLKLMVPLFREVEEKIKSGEISVAQKHALSAIFSYQIGQLVGLHYQKKPSKDDLILVAAPEGELHGSGCLASALLCVHYGIRFIHLGENLPAAALAEASNALRPKTVLLATSDQGIEDRNTLMMYLNNLTTNLHGNPEVWIEGRPSEAVQAELTKRKIPYFSSLDALDRYLQSF